MGPQMLGKWAENLEKYMRSCDTCDNNDSSHIRSNINLFKKNWFNSGFHKGDPFRFSWLTKYKGTKDDDKIRCTVNGQVKPLGDSLLAYAEFTNALHLNENISFDLIKTLYE